MAEGLESYLMFFGLYYTGILPVFLLIGYFFYILQAQELALVSVAFNGLALNFWLGKQTVLSAWLLALAGMCCGPGLASRVPFDSMSDGDAFYYGLISMNAFYLCFGIVNWLQKKYWPNNKFCNRIRDILRWPCGYRESKPEAPEKMAETEAHK